MERLITCTNDGYYTITIHVLDILQIHPHACVNAAFPPYINRLPFQLKSQQSYCLNGVLTRQA